MLVLSGERAAPEGLRPAVLSTSWPPPAKGGCRAQHRGRDVRHARPPDSNAGRVGTTSCRQVTAERQTVPAPPVPAPPVRADTQSRGAAAGSAGRPQLQHRSASQVSGGLWVQRHPHPCPVPRRSRKATPLPGAPPSVPCGGEGHHSPFTGPSQALIILIAYPPN